MANPDEIKLAERLRELANAIDPPQIALQPETRADAAEQMRAAADVLQYGNCNYWCPACYAAISKPEHRYGVMVGAPGDTDAERAAWLADKIVAGGDYAKEAAQMLRRWPAPDATAALRLVTDALRDALTGGRVTAHKAAQALEAAALVLDANGVAKVQDQGEGPNQ